MERIMICPDCHQEMVKSLLENADGTIFVAWICGCLSLDDRKLEISPGIYYYLI